MGNVLNRWDLDPRKARSSELQRYVTSSALRDFMRVYQQMAAQHLAYRGNPDTPHLKVATVGSSAAVFTDCSTPSKTNPSVQYSVRTGQPVKSTVPPGLHPKVVTVLDQSGHWKVNSIIPNLGQTCTP
jgi:hypothetical protein